MMEIRRCKKDSFSVIGKEGSTKDGDGFIAVLWEKANQNFSQVEPFVKKDADGNGLSIWGLMSDFSRSFRPWEDEFSKGLYLAGVEVMDDAQPPAGWVKWTVPSYEYLYVKAQGETAEVFTGVLEYLNTHGIELAGAVHDYICPEENGQLYMFFPIKKL